MDRRTGRKDAVQGRTSFIEPPRQPGWLGYASAGLVMGSDPKKASPSKLQALATSVNVMDKCAAGSAPQTAPCIFVAQVHT